MLEPRVYTNFSSPGDRNSLGWCVDEEAEVPARGAFDDTTTVETPCRKSLSMEPHASDAWDTDTGPLWRFEGIRKGDARQFVPLPFQSGLLCQFLIAAVPRGIRRIQHALQRVTGDAEFFAVIGQQIVKGFLAVKDAVFGVLLDLAYRPIPDACQVQKPRVELCVLGTSEAQFELPLDHPTPVSDCRYTA